MGGGTWSASTYASTTRSKIDTGTTFGYTTATASSSRSSWSAHEDLDPTKLNAAGLNIRESRDSDEHPNALPIAIVFDDTGSMQRVPRDLQADLGNLYGTILRKGYAEDPQVLVGAYGDAECDRVPLQIAQFESDNRIDDNLDKLFLEGGGGGNNGESMALAWYYIATHTATDAFEKRGKKGYAFFIGDEVALKINASQVKQFIGDEQPLLEDLSHDGLLAALREKWDAYVLIVDNTTAGWQGSVKFYTGLFGDHAIVLQDPSAVSATIALMIGVLEGTVDLDEGADDLIDSGMDRKTVEAATKALAVVGADGKASSGAVVTSELPPKF